MSLLNEMFSAFLSSASYFLTFPTSGVYIIKVCADLSAEYKNGFCSIFPSLSLIPALCNQCLQCFRRRSEGRRGFGERRRGRANAKTVCLMSLSLSLFMRPTRSSQRKSSTGRQIQARVCFMLSRSKGNFHEVSFCNGEAERNEEKKKYILCVPT